MEIVIEHVYDYQLFCSITLPDAWLLVIDGIPSYIDENPRHVVELYNKLH